MNGLARKLIVAFDTAAVATVRIFLTSLPRDRARFAGSVFGAMALFVSPGRRKRALENLRNVMPHLTRKQRSSICRQCFIQFGAGFAEVYHLQRRKGSYLRRFVSIDGLHHLHGALARGKGAIVVGSHLSSFPIGMLALANENFPVAVVVRQADNDTVERMNNDIRRNYGLSWIYVKPRQEAARNCMKWLRQGKILWIQVDQRNRTGIVAQFLGHLCQVAPGAALFARRTGCPVLPAVIVRNSSSRYRVSIGEEIPVSRTGDRQSDLRVNMERFLHAFAPHILGHPCQWTWFHKMWKVREDALTR